MGRIAIPPWRLPASQLTSSRWSLTSSGYGARGRQLVRNALARFDADSAKARASMALYEHSPFLGHLSHHPCVPGLQR